jgi:hypothetical protein
MLNRPLIPSNLEGKYRLPPLPVPAVPRVMYASGGYVAGGGIASDPRLDTLIARIEDGFEKLSQKDYTVQVKTNFKGVEFAREIDAAQQEYKRRIV